MCGIIGVISDKSVKNKIINGLAKLEYRGYDSAGIATINDAGIVRIRAKGKLQQLRDKISSNDLTGTIGIGHTRWATHGPANEVNSHPHLSGGCAIVHNGIIENFYELKQKVIADGKIPQSDTDSEIIAHLIALELEQTNDLEQAVANTMPLLIGSFSIVVMCDRFPDILIGARKGSPLVIGINADEKYFASDATAIADLTNNFIYLEDGDRAVISRKDISVYDHSNNPVIRSATISDMPPDITSKGNYRHFMLKEIFDQPEAIAHTIASYTNLNDMQINLPSSLLSKLANCRKIIIVACGAAMYAGYIARSWFERFTRIATEVDIASEFRYRQIPLTSNDIVIIISQSGETADTISALDYCRQKGTFTLAIVNVPQSSIARKADAVMLTAAWPEIGVASTKAFTAQLTLLAIIAIGISHETGKADDISRLISDLTTTPRCITETLRLEQIIATNIAPRLPVASNVIYIGRGANYPMALEGALKLKELAYISAQGYAAGELKHGPIALVDSKTIAIVIVPYDDLFSKTISNMNEIIARGCKIIAITDSKGEKILKDTVDYCLPVHHTGELSRVISTAIPVQLIAYHTGLYIGTDVDQPRNLAKSVTVE